MNGWSDLDFEHVFIGEACTVDVERTAVYV